MASTEYEKYEEIYRILTKDMPVPNVVVYLHASVETLMKRIAMRGREFEKMISRDYMGDLWLTIILLSSTLRACIPKFQLSDLMEISLIL